MRESISSVVPQPADVNAVPNVHLNGIQRLSLFYWGAWAVIFGLGIYFGATFLSIFRLIILRNDLFVPTIEKFLWLSGLPTTIGILLIALDLGLMLPSKRRLARRPVTEVTGPSAFTVVLTAYNDEASISDAVQDFLAHPLVRRVIVVSNNSTDHTIERPRRPGRLCSTRKNKVTERASIVASKRRCDMRTRILSLFARVI